MLEDLRLGRVTIEGARRDYGVVAIAAPGGPCLDDVATQALRRSLRDAAR